MCRKKILTILSIMVLSQVLILFSIPVHAVEIPKNAVKLEKKGDKAFEKKDYDKALEYYIQALDVYPEGDKLHYKCASILAFKKEYPMAIDHLKKALTINRGDSKILLALANTMLDLGKSQMSKGEMKEANATYLAILNLPGVDQLGQGIVEKVKYQVGVNFFNFQDYRESRKFLLQFLQTEGMENQFPDFSAIATYILGTDLLQLKEYQNSTQYFEKFINMPGMDTKFPAYYTLSHYLAGIGFSELEQYEKGITFLKKFIELNTNVSDRYVILAKYKIGSNYFESLKKEIRDIEKQTNRNNIKQQKQKIETMARERTVIKAFLEEAVTGDDKLEPAYTILGNYHYLCGDLTNARKYYRLLIEKFPESQDIEVYKTFLKDIENSISQKN